MEGLHCLCVESESGNLRFESPSKCIQYQLDKGFNFGGSCLKPQDPVASETCELEPLPSKDLLCDGKETDFFSGTISAGKKRSSITQLKLLASGESTDLSKPLLFACINGSSSATQLVLNEADNLDVNDPLQCTNGQELTPLALASLSPSPQVCELLIKAGAGVNLTDQLGRSALHWAVLGCHLTTLRVLLKHKADVNLKDDKGFTPLLYGCLLGAQEIVSCLLKEGAAQVDLSHTETNLTPLMIACSQGHTNVVKLLFKYHANVSLTDSQEFTALLHAVWSRGSSHLKCVKMLLSHCGRAVLSQRDSWGRTPLLIAAAKGDPQMCQFLLKKGVWLGEVDSEGRTVLHWAILSQQISCVEFLLGYNGGHHQLCNQPDNSGATPAHYAAMSTNDHILRLLKTKEATLSVCDQYGYSVLLWAAVCGRDNSVRLLTETDDRGSTDEPETERKGEGSSNMLHPLHGAASVGSVSVCQVLIDSEGKVNVISPSGLTPLHYVSRYGHTECVRLLLSKGAHVDSLTPQQESPLHLASTHGHGGVADELLSNGAVIDRPVGTSGDCPVHLASAKGHVKLLNVLIRHGCNVDLPRCSDHQHPIHLAACNGHLSCCKVLIEKQCDTSTRLPTVERLTALDLAMINNHRGCADYLMYCHAPSGGGVFHRAASTIQASWKYYRHKCRVATARQWCAVVIQRAFRSWLLRRRAGRVKEAREKLRQRAAQVIQSRWRLYIREKRRYEATYVKLKIRLQQEHLATALLLTELHSQTQNIRLPPVTTTTTTTTLQQTRSFNPPSSVGGLKPGYLLKVSHNPTPIFPSGSLMFPVKPRKPLIKTAPPNIKIKQPSLRMRLPSLERVSMNTECNPVTPPPSPANEAFPDSNERTRLPPMSMAPSLTGVQFDETSRGSLNIVSNENLTSRVSPNTEKLTNRNSPSMQSLQPKLPPISPLNNSMISTNEMVDSSSHDHHSSNTIEHKDRSILQEQSNKLVSESNDQLVSSDSTTKKMHLLTRSKAARMSIFKDAPLSHKPIASRKQNHSSVTQPLPTTSDDDLPPTQAGDNDDLTDSVTEEEKTFLHKSEDQSTPDSSHVLNHVQRYDRLNEVLGLLQQAKQVKDADSLEGDVPVKMSSLKQHIKTALDEAVRLRAETEALQERVISQGTRQTSTVNS